MAVLAVLVMLATALVPVASVSDGATSWSGTDSWKVVLHTETDKNNCEQLTVHLYKNGSEVTDLKSIAQDTAVSENAVYTSSAKNADGSRKNVGSWGFNDDGYGPFNSFYAAFDPSNSNRMVCHLDPYDLTKSVDGKTAVTIDGKEVKISDCNIMWCLPTVWWGTDSEGNLVMTNIKTDGMTAYAHTVDGTTYSYLAIGVYEASRKSVGNEDILMSRSNTNPMTATQRAVFRDYANNQEVVTDGKDSGHAMLWNFYQYELYKYCTLAVIGSWDSQTVAGNGSYAIMNAGLLNSSGPYSGTRGSNYYQSAKVFIENAWGSCYDNVDGIVINGTSGYYIDTSSNPTDSVTAGGNVTYVNVALPNCYAGYGTSPSKDERIWGMPTASGGSGTTGLYDQISTSTGHNALLSGGSSSSAWDKIGMGVSCFLANYSTTASFTDVGARISFVFGADPTASVKYDHSQLESLLVEYGYSTNLMSGLSTGKTISGNTGYEKLPDIPDDKGFRHVGWIIDGKEYPVNQAFVKTSAHTAKSVWVGLPAVTYDHKELVKLSDDPDSVSGLNNGLEIKDHDRYEQLPSRDGCTHVGWRVEFDGRTVDVGPTDKLVTRQSHTAVSLWIKVPTVTFDHSQLTDLVGKDAKGVSDLQTSMAIGKSSKYPQLPNTAGYRHVGWVIDGEQVGPTAGLVSQETHDAESVWEKITIIPIFPDADDDADVIEVIVPKDSEPWIDRNGKTVLLVAIVVAIIAELAVLSISRKR